MDFTFAEMERFAAVAWGELGANVARKWAEFNAEYFGGTLRPTPIIITSTLPYGHRVADCIGGLNGGRRLIRLNVPAKSDVLVADNNTLLHEMIHQYLAERNEKSKHAGDPWCREIMRLNKQITGTAIWAGRSKTFREGKRIYRANQSGPNGEQSFTQDQIARWPHDNFGINLGRLGA